jgi:hypothetical protein
VSLALSSQARAAQRQAALLAERDRALLDLVAMLDPHGTRVAWQVAGEIAGLLRRFSGEPLRRIQAGHRSPRGDIEPLLLSLVEGGTPTSQRRVYGLLAELTRQRQ